MPFCSVSEFYTYLRIGWYFHVSVLQLPMLPYKILFLHFFLSMSWWQQWWFSLLSHHKLFPYIHCQKLHFLQYQILLIMTKNFFLWIVLDVRTVLSAIVCSCKLQKNFKMQIRFHKRLLLLKNNFSAKKCGSMFCD